MPASKLPAEFLESNRSEPVSQDHAPDQPEIRSVARQPILNLSGRLHGYELLFRGAGGSSYSWDAEGAIAALVDDTVTFGLDRFTNGFPAFIRCTAGALTSQLVQVLPTAITVLAIPETIDLSPELVQTCRALKSQGFRFALDDFTGRAHPLLDVASYVRVDFSNSVSPLREELRRQFAPDVVMMAKKVETEQDHRLAAAEGFTLLQGDYLFRPAGIANRKIPVNRLFHFEILQELYREPVDLKRLGKLVMRDAALSYRLLRLVNSPVCALRQEVRSVEAAIIVVGLDTFRRFATLAILAEPGSSQQFEILHMALVRARFCETGARMARLNAAEQYLLGLFSLLPAMLRIPMSELAPSLPLHDEIREALEGAANRERCLLEWFERHEHGEWQACDTLALTHRLRQKDLIQNYGDAMVWANTALQTNSLPS